LAICAISQPTVSASSVQRLMIQCCLLVQGAVQKEKVRLASVRVKEDSALAAEVASVSGQQVPGAATLEELLRRPHVHYRQAVQRASPLLLQRGSKQNCRVKHSRLSASFKYECHCGAIAALQPPCVRVCKDLKPDRLCHREAEGSTWGTIVWCLHMRIKRSLTESVFEHICPQGSASTTAIFPLVFHHFLPFLSCLQGFEQGFSKEGSTNVL